MEWSKTKGRWIHFWLPFPRDWVDDETRNMALILFARLMEVDQSVADSEYETYSTAKRIFGV